VSITAGPAPRNGTCSTSIPTTHLEQLEAQSAASRRCRRGILNLAGLFLGGRTNFFDVVDRQTRMNRERVGLDTTSEIGANALCGS